jgi:hypothetical protein
MKNFRCAGCGMTVFFENDHCVKCERKLGFLPDSMTIGALEEKPGNQWFQLTNHGSAGPYRKCENANQHHLCNWMVVSGDENRFCLCCRLNEVIPDLTVEGNCELWRKLELAKKRCLYPLIALGLPTEGVVQENRPALRFRFLASTTANSTIATGHSGGVITVNIAEADDDERERRRLRLHEPYRTLVGHFRHELGHYYWDRLIANSPHVWRYRELFGDETVDYETSLQNYYRQGPTNDWTQRTVTAYASAHPWEDWAETWAHYLHICDTLETADCFGFHQGVLPAKQDNFEEMFERWIPLSGALNAVNRGMGLPDLYPFVIPEASVKKLRFIHDLIGTSHKPGNLIANR